MIIRGVEVNRDNLSDWSAKALRNMKIELKSNIKRGAGEINEEKLLINMMSIEIKRQIKIKNINLAAEKETEKVIKQCG